MSLIPSFACKRQKFDAFRYFQRVERQRGQTFQPVATSERK